MKKATKKVTKKKATAKKAPSKESTVNNQYGNGGKTAIVKKMVAAGKNRKQILDKLESMNPDVPRKSNAGLVSVILNQMDKRNIASGVEGHAKKKTIKVKGSKTTKASGSKKKKSSK